MKLETFILTFMIIILIRSKIYTTGKPLTKSEKKDINNNIYNSKRDLENKNGYDSYIELYFNEDCNYYSGFQNKYRSNIGFIINKENNKKLTSKEKLIIHKGIGIEIHFNTSVTILDNFFNSSSDKNMKLLISIDFTNFNSSYIKSMYSLFYGCSSLISIDFTNFNTSLTYDMSSMF